MTISYAPPGADLFDTTATALVNTVNTVGVMGKGIALGVKRRWPQVYRDYREMCRRGEIAVGHVSALPTGVAANPVVTGPSWILNLPTKQHWRNPSRLEWIDSGLIDLARVIEELALDSVALPPPGCGNGGLDWAQVQPLIQARLGIEPLAGVDITVYPPAQPR